MPTGQAKPRASLTLPPIAGASPRSPRKTTLLTVLTDATQPTTRPCSPVGRRKAIPRRSTHALSNWHKMKWSIEHERAALFREIESPTSRNEKIHQLMEWDAAKTNVATTAKTIDDLVVHIGAPSGAPSGATSARRCRAG